MLDGGIIQRLLEEKWKTFARVNIFERFNFFGNKVPDRFYFLFRPFQNQFLKRLLILFTHLFFLSISVYLRPATENLQNKLEAESATDTILQNGGKDDSENGDDVSLDVITVLRYISEIATLLGVLSYLILQQGDEIKNQGLPAFLKQLVRLNFFLFCVFSPRPFVLLIEK